MDDPTRKKDFEKSANEYFRWVFNANSFLNVSIILEDKFKSENTHLKDELLSQLIYFKACSLELYLKALYIKQGNKVTENGKFIFDIHNLVKICILTKIPIDNIQRELLHKLTDFITTWGRYPVPLYYKKWRYEIKEKPGTPPIYTWDENENRFLINFILKIKSLTDLSKDNNLPWSKTY